MGCGHGETRGHRRYRHRRRSIVPGTRARRTRPPRWYTQYLEVPSQVRPHAHIPVSLYDANQRFGWDRRRIETVYGDKVNEGSADAFGHAPKGQEI